MLYYVTEKLGCWAVISISLGIVLALYITVIVCIKLNRSTPQPEPSVTAEKPGYRQAKVTEQMGVPNTAYSFCNGKTVNLSN